jgi:Protein of unknown function (DUF1800)
MPTNTPLLDPYKPTAADPFDSLKAAHLLNRAGFGGTPDDVKRVVEMGPQNAVDWLLDFPDLGAEEQSPDVPNLSTIADYPKDFNELKKLYLGKTPEEQKALRMKVMMANREAVRATVDWWMRRMVYGQQPLQEKLTLFWHGHFVTSAKDERSALAMWKQNELLRANAVGNFRHFVRAISRDPAMLDYLNNSQNRKAHPNENYARELMELFTLGIGNYSETDVKEAARAFTGWAHDEDEFVFRKFDHDNGVKTFLGHTGNFNGDDVIDIILSQPVCARFIASKLFRFFAFEEFDDTFAESLGSTFRGNNYEIRPLVRTILTSQAFYSSQSIGSQIKSPIQLVLGTVRLAGLQIPPDRLVEPSLNQMGQMPFSPPNVRGWPGGRMWINTSTLFVRYNTGVRLLAGDVPLVDGGRLVDATHGSIDSEAVVDYWVVRLIQRPIALEKKQVLIDALADQPRSEQNVRKMVQLIVSMPEYQLC